MASLVNNGWPQPIWPMNPVALSVIVCMAPGHEDNLAQCLSVLTKQTLPHWEVIVVDDGSSAGITICQNWQNRLRLGYHWRENDCCPSRSRNIGVHHARSRNLVFIDADVLLNPFALQHYLAYLSQPGEQIYYGYYGREPLVSRSLWFGESSVHWWDERYQFCDNGQPMLKAEVFYQPYHYGWSGNFGIHKDTFLQLKGFNESFMGWGREDNEFAIRATQAGIPLHFTLDPWGEHLCHSIDDRFNRLSQAMAAQKDNLLVALGPVTVTAETKYYATEFQGQALTKIIDTHYQPLATMA